MDLHGEKWISWTQPVHMEIGNNSLFVNIQIHCFKQAHEKLAQWLRRLYQFLVFECHGYTCTMHAYSHVSIRECPYLEIIYIWMECSLYVYTAPEAIPRG